MTSVNIQSISKIRWSLNEKLIEEFRAINVKIEKLNSNLTITKVFQAAIKT